MRILYIAASSFPEGSAYSTRVYGICKALQFGGNQLFVLTDSKSQILEGDCFEGISVRCGSKHLVTNRTRLDNCLSKYTMIYQLISLLKKEKIDCVISSSVYKRYKAILRISHHYKIPVILESCEWFDENNWKKGKDDKGYKSYIKAWNKAFCYNDGVIAISRLLEEHYKEFSSNVLRLPTMMDVQNTRWKRKINNITQIRILFSGSIAWGKDRLIDVIRALEIIQNERVELHIYGPSVLEIKEQIGGLVNSEIFKKSVFIHNRLPHCELMDVITEYDIGVIVRPNRQQSNAGFPTKLAEYMAAGIPVIANDTGDIGLYLKNGDNGFLKSKDINEKDIAEAIRQYVNLEDNQKDDMRQTARETALSNFDFRENAYIVNSFVEKVVKNSDFINRR